MIKPNRLASFAAALLAGAAVLGACGNKEREAEADTGKAEAEVSTNLPESQVSDEQLRAAAEGAAAIAETPQGTATSVVVTPPAEPAAGAGAAAPAAPAKGGAEKH